MFDYALSLVVKLYVGMFCIKLDYQSKGIIHAHIYILDTMGRITVRNLREDEEKRFG
jgi:hypothetical protein